MKNLACALVAVSFLFSHAAHAQGWSQNSYGGGYTVTTPGEPTAFVNPNPIGGGYTINTPGQTPSFINPNPIGGGYTVTTPGQPTTFINPNPRYGR